MRQLTTINPHGFYFGIETWIYIAVSLLLGLWIPWIDQNIFPGWFSPVDSATLLSILAAIASGMITLSGLVFSLLFVLVQFGTTTYSPRLSRIFAHSFVLRHSLGIFTGTFLYSLMAMRSVGFQNTGTSGIAIWIAFVWLLLSVGILAGLVNVFITMTITNTLRSLSNIGRDGIHRIYTSNSRQNADNRNSGKNSLHSELYSQRVIYTGYPGYVVGYNIERLLKIAQKTDSVLYLPNFIGDAIRNGSELVLIKCDSAPVPEDIVLHAIQYDISTGFRNDPRYALRLLVDIAIRALSPAVNDPTTAVQVLDHIEYLLSLLGNSNLDIGEVSDTNGVLRVVFKTPDWKDYLQLGLVEITHYGATSIQVQRRLKALLTDLMRAVPPDRAEVVYSFTGLQTELVQQSFEYEPFRQLASIYDREGIGSGMKVKTDEH
ncbi:MAG TPA: DUF2254 domain-containing protein [Chitinispirillaceae bacterium]|nr:DUF2254 domain-containing protein [Chitinispirillaceae bacterium]